MDINEYFALMQFTEDQMNRFEIVPLMNIPSFDISWIHGKEFSLPNEELIFRDLKYVRKMGLVSYIGVKEDVEHQLQLLTSINPNNGSFNDQDLIEIKTQLFNLQKQVKTQQTEIEELKAFKRENSYILEKVESLKIGFYNEIGVNRLKILHDQLSMAMTHDDLKGCKKLIELVLGISTKDRKWSNFTEREETDVEDVMSYYIVMKDIYEQKCKQSLPFDPKDLPVDIISIKSPNPSGPTDPVAERYKKVRLSFQRAMQARGPQANNTEDDNNNSKDNSTTFLQRKENSNKQKVKVDSKSKRESKTNKKAKIEHVHSSSSSKGNDELNFDFL